jgi:hypothetical protein
VKILKNTVAFVEEISLADAAGIVGGSLPSVEDYFASWCKTYTETSFLAESRSAEATYTENYKIYSITQPESSGYGPVLQAQSTDPVVGNFVVNLK